MSKFREMVGFQSAGTATSALNNVQTTTAEVAQLTRSQLTFGLPKDGPHYRRLVQGFERIFGATIFFGTDEERQHAMKFVQYMLDTKGELKIPAIPAPNPGRDVPPANGPIFRCFHFLP
jgi:hypothetical protein